MHHLLGFMIALEYTSQNRSHSQKSGAFHFDEGI
jgi:hypothetical protein